MRIASLDRSQLSSARSVLSVACRFDRADVVADEKLFGLGPKGAPIAIGAWMSSDELASSHASTGADGARYGGEVLVGVAAICGTRIRLLAVAPDARGRGVGSALLAACEDTARANGATSLRTLDEPGNYLAPGIDVRNTDTIEWLERRGWQRSGELRENVLIRVRDNPRVTQGRLESLIASCAARGYEVRRARVDEYALLDAVSSEFGGAWPFELARALDFAPGTSMGASNATAGASTGGSNVTASASTGGSNVTASGSTGGSNVAAGASTGGSNATTSGSTGASGASRTPGVHVALRNGVYCAFAAHDGNNAGLGWFGPTGTWPAHRGNGLGEAVLVACLVDVAIAHEFCEVAWIGPRPFYDKVAGVESDRRFVLLAKPL